MSRLIFAFLVLTGIVTTGHAESAKTAISVRSAMQSDIDKMYEIQTQFGNVDGSDFASAWFRGLGQNVESSQQKLQALFAVGRRATAQEVRDARSEIQKMRSDAEAAWTAWSTGGVRSKEEGAASDAVSFQE